MKLLCCLSENTHTHAHTHKAEADSWIGFNACNWYTFLKTKKVLKVTVQHQCVLIKCKFNVRKRTAKRENHKKKLLKVKSCPLRWRMEVVLLALKETILEGDDLWQLLHFKPLHRNRTLCHNQQQQRSKSKLRRCMFHRLRFALKKKKKNKEQNIFFIVLQSSSWMTTVSKAIIAIEGELVLRTIHLIQREKTGHVTSF